MLEKIFWLGHSTIRIDTEPVIYIDPWKVKKPKKAGLVLVSHGHYDHTGAVTAFLAVNPNAPVIYADDATIRRFSCRPFPRRCGWTTSSSRSWAVPGSVRGRWLCRRTWSWI